MRETVLGNNGEKIIVFYSFKDVSEFNKFREGMSNLINAKVLQSTLFVVFMENASEKLYLPDSVRFKYLAKSDFNFFGQVKDKNLRQSMKDKFDVLLVFGNIQENQLKRINKISATKRIVTNSAENLKFDISINANTTSIEQIANFTKETLEKIKS